MSAKLILFGVEVDEACYGSSAYGAKFRVLVCPHATVGERAVDSVHGVSGWLVGSDVPFLHFLFGFVECGRNLGAFLDHVFPFRVEVYERR